MIFKGKSINDITDDEIDTLVNNHVSERQHLEFKVTINHKEDAERLELLHDITSLANGGGGYLIVGIRDNGKGCAQRYEPSLIGDTERIKKAIMNLCHDHISERIEGLEVAARMVRDNPLVIVRVPASARVPHMTTYSNRTDFYNRYHDGKREMTIGEIKEAFNKDIVGRRLSTIETHLRKIITSETLDKERKDILERIKSGVAPYLLTIEDGYLLSDVTSQRFEAEIGDTPYFWMAATPVKPRATLINVDSDKIRQLIQNPPGSRQDGWNMASSYFSIERFAEGIRRGKKDLNYLEVLQNGHMEFWTPLDDHFCWQQSPEEFRRQPRLYPYPVTEYPSTFLKLYRALIDVTEIKDDFLISLHYRNVNGYIVFPYAPNTFGFEFPRSEIKPFDKQHLVVPRRKVSSDFGPDKTAYNLVKVVYAAFGLEAKTIPFFKGEGQKFDFLSS